MNRLRSAIRIPPPQERVRSWHVSPAIDMLAYHFSWLWVLLPMIFAGSKYPGDYLALYVVVLSVGFVHRHYTLGYVYLDREIFARHRRRFICAPLILGAALLATPVLLKASVPSGALSIGGLRWPGVDFPLKVLITAVVFGAGLWNIWHTLAQKYGILRIYSAKARIQNEASVPGWVDRLFVMGWLPLIASYVAPPFADAILTEFWIARWFLEPIVGWLVIAEPIAAPIAAAFAIVSSAIFTAFEWRTHRFRNRPRLSMAIGIGSLWVCFLLVDPIKVYLASRSVTAWNTWFSSGPTSGADTPNRAPPNPSWPGCSCIQGSPTRPIHWRWRRSTSCCETGRTSVSGRCRAFESAG